VRKTKEATCFNDASCGGAVAAIGSVMVPKLGVKENPCIKLGDLARLRNVAEGV
jgi:hypothetical protein